MLSSLPDAKYIIRSPLPPKFEAKRTVEGANFQTLATYSARNNIPEAIYNTNCVIIIQPLPYPQHHRHYQMLECIIRDPIPPKFEAKRSVEGARLSDAGDIISKMTIYQTLSATSSQTPTPSIIYECNRTGGKIQLQYATHWRLQTNDENPGSKT
jgi:hypothetical protein